MSIKAKLSALGCAVFLAATASPALAGTKDDIRDLQARMQAAEQAARAQGATTVRIGELERQIQELTGRIEELSYELDTANQRLDAISAALAGASPETAAAIAADPMRRPGGGPVDLSTGDPIADQITNATPAADTSSAVGGGDVALPLDPKAAFQLYVEAFPNSSRTPDAQFRLGEIHLALGENAAAADVFINHIRSYPNDPRAAEAYLKLGTAFARLEKPKEACTVFKTMKTKYPNAPSAVASRADIEMARINCQ
jgi:tol-pal system protein YbgF